MLAALGDSGRYRRVLCVGPLRPREFSGVAWRPGGHPVPDAESVRAATHALAIAHDATPGDVVLVLLSGGASSMMAAPAAGVTLQAKRTTIEMLMQAGATINELNTVRKHVSAVKGGQLAATCAAAFVTLAISDVTGDDPSTIGSGPTVPDATTFGDAVNVLISHGGLDAYPPAVTARLRAGAAGDILETPKPTSGLLARSTVHVIGSVRDALAAAAREATALGYQVHVVEEPTIGEAPAAGAAFARKALAMRSRVPRCVLAGGETTVTVRGPGRGGRNQECALGMVASLEALDCDVIAASVGTDGIDGPTDAAGAIVDRSTASRARSAGLDIQAALDNNDSLALFEALGDLIHTGPTGANVGDVQIMLIGA
jgi:glycerate 2-kinase